MRTFHVDPERGFSGGEVQVMLLLEGLLARGLPPVLATQPGSQLASRAHAAGIEVVEIAMRGDLHLACVPRLCAAMKATGAELVHLHTGRANWLGGLAAARAGLPAISTRRMDRRVKGGLKDRYIYRRLVRHTAAIAPAVEARLHAGGVPAERTSLVWSAVDPRAVRPSRARADVRAELGVGSDEVVILTAGALSVRKGYDVLLAAVAQLATPPRVWIAGEGSLRAALEQQRAELGLVERVQLLGRRSDIPDLLGAADLFAMPSRAEGLGVAALEAMAAGRAVVASAVGGLGQAVVDGRTGLLVAPDDPAALARALARLVDDADLRERLGAAGPERVGEGFLPDQMVESYLALYQGLVPAAVPA